MTAKIYNFADYKRARMLAPHQRDVYREHVRLFLQGFAFDSAPASDCGAPNGQAWWLQ
jgi:hypothetical protein